MNNKPNKGKTYIDSDAGQDVENDEAIGHAVRWSLVAALVVVACVGGGFAIKFLLGKPVQEERSTDITLPQQRTVERAALPSLPLRDTTAPAGLDWVHVSGMAGEKLLPETMGGGVAVFDYDRDGDLDLLFVGGKSWDWAQTPIANPRSLCLYQNDGTAHFTDVTVQAGLNKTLYGMGPAVGDFDNDGWDDLYITAVGENLLFRNVEGKFQDVSQQSQTAGPADAWSTGASWLDYDNDGRLDLFVCDYVVWSRDLDLSLGFSLTGLGRAFGQPTSFTGTNSRLYHNEGEGRFLDVSEVMGVQVQNPNVQVPIGKGMGVAPVDVNHDGWIDVMVANDTVQNFLFINDEGKGFIESAIPCGVAFDRSGNATGAMGIDCSYFRNDDTLAIAVGNFANEPSSFFTSRGREMLFIDNALPTGLGPVSRLYLTFGMFFADLDLDSRQDIVCANGHLEAEISKVQSTQEYAQPPQFFWNAGAKGDTELIALSEAQVGPEATKPMVGRGAAYGDLDGDGDLDIVLVENSGPPRVLLNDQQLGHHWLRLKLVGAGKSNRNAYGALVTLVSGATRQRRFVNATRSYLSQCEATLTFGLGNQTGVDQIEIQWPDGQQQVISAPAIDQLHVITQNETGS